jgi:hypothetical protein
MLFREIITLLRESYRIYKNALSKISLRVPHTLSRQAQGRKIVCVEWYLLYNDFGSHRVLKIESSNFQMMTVIFVTI